MTAPLKCAYKPCSKYGRREKMLVMPNRRAFCDASHALQWAQENAEKKRAKAKQAKVKAANAEKRKRKAADLPHQLELTRIEVNKLVRLLDQGKPCISCNKHRELEAGHYRGVGSMPSLRFNLLNIYGQCRPCNGSGTMSYKRGKNPALVRDDYERLLRLRMGDALVDWLNGPHPVQHWTCDELRAIRAEAAAECRRLKKGEGPSKDWRQLPQRSKAA